MKMIIKSLLLVILFVSLPGVFCAEKELKPVDPKLAESAPSSPKNFTFRIYGLCCPERENDLKMATGEIPDVKLVSIDYPNASATFSLDPILFCAERVKGMSKKDLANADLPKFVNERFDNLLRNASNHTFQIAPPLAAAKDKLTLVEIKVVGIDCKACSFAAYDSICKIEGVARATASFKQGMVTALIDPSKTNRSALETALKQRGVELFLTPEQKAAEEAKQKAAEDAKKAAAAKAAIETKKP